MSARRLLASLGTVSLAWLALISARPATARLESAVANDNRTPAGTMVADTLVLRLTVTPVAWHLLGDSAPAFTVLAFAEEGKAPSIPGPLIRARVGTPVRVTVNNPLDDTLIVRGLSERDLVVLLSDGVPWRTYINGSLTPAPKELEVGKTYRLRIADIAVFRLALSVRLVRDSALLSWRPIAKDGFTLPPAQAMVRPSVVNLPSGETADFEFTPDRPGELALEVLGQQPPVNLTLHSRLPFRVSPAAGDSGSAKSSGARARPRR